MNRTLRYGLALVAALFFAVYVGVAIARMGYPFQLEWMEGGSLAHVKRVLNGKPIYAAPSLDFVPYLYPPFYFYLSAALCQVLGPSFLPLRCLSFLSSLGCFACIFWTVKRETKESFPALLSAGLFAASFGAGGAWFDLARVDSLFLFFLWACIAAIRSSSSLRAGLAAGILVSLSCLVKQTALVACVPLAVHSLIFRRRSAVPFLAAMALIVGGTTLFYEKTSQGWYSFYLFSMPSQHLLLRRVLFSFWTRDILCHFPVASALAAWTVWTGIRRGEWDRSMFFLLTGGGLFAGSWMSRLHSGGYDNVLLPAYTVLCAGFGMGVHRASIESRCGKRPWPGRTSTLLWGLCIFQFGVLFYNPFEQLPTAADERAANGLKTRMSAVPGEVWAPCQGHLSSLAGKGEFAHQAPMWDVFRCRDDRARSSLEKDVKEALRSKRFSAIVLDPELLCLPWFAIELGRSYEPRGRNFSDEKVFWPVTGRQGRPELFFVRKLSPDSGG